MTNQQILEKDVQKAIDCGWGGFSYEPDTFVGLSPDKLLTSKYYDDTHEFVYDLQNNISVGLNEIIFNHDFANALWGDEPTWPVDDGKKDDAPNWQYHLQQLVVAHDVFKYLEEHAL